MGESHLLLTLNKTRNNILGDAIQEQLIREHCYTSIYNGRTLDMCESTERSSRAVACLHHIITLGALVYLHNTHTRSHAHTHTLGFCLTTLSFHLTSNISKLLKEPRN